MIPEKTPGEKSIIKSVLFYGFCWAVLIFMIMPNFVVFPISFSSATYLEFPPKSWSLRWYHDYFSRSEWVSATITSFEVAILVTFISVILKPCRLWAYSGPLSRQEFSKFADHLTHGCTHPGNRSGHLYPLRKIRAERHLGRIYYCTHRHGNSVCGGGHERLLTRRAH